ncbi:GntR family transcriptional regulator [Amycolatopsis sp. DSM 110486]|uniref:GntR family transcriptional regulator n=1 Tax=Amycolatopsis sp. DSM 110486 TaxID=2865832 RepID=UPI001C6A1A4E|nr:GntR family transcriptional regulator [Amycolatopsis sp. DSM 110486]QYN20488.1 GntR family transcriptional regulator [Amycolatopsis sp. DSM 110486]
MENRETLVDRLRTAIVHGELFPGQRLVEVDLAAAFGSSRGSVREALVMLENEGLVIRERNRGASVRPISLREAIEITEVRAVVEGLCARKAASAIGAEDRRRLQKLAKAMRAAVKAGDIAGYNDISQESHHVIRELGDQRTATEVLERLRYPSVRYQFQVSLLPGRIEEGLAEHVSVIEAVASGDGDRAEAAMRAHLSSLVGSLQKLSELGGLPRTTLGRTPAS